MTIRWSSDSCDCIIDMETGTTNFEGWVQKCNLHKALTGQALLDGAATHNRTFQILEADQDDAVKRNTNTVSKRTEKASIIAAGPTEKNPRARRVRLGN